MPDVAELIHSAQRAIEQGDHQRALPFLREAVKLGPAAFGAHLLLGICLSTVGETAEGVRSLQQAVRLNPSSALGHYNLAIAFRAAGRTAEADHHLREAQRCDPGFTAAATALKALRAGSSLGTEFRFPGSPELVSAVRTFPQEEPASPTIPQAPPAPMRLKQPPPPLPPRSRRLRLGRYLTLGIMTLGAIGLLVWRTIDQPLTDKATLWRAPGDFVALDFSPNGELLACGGEKTMAWKTATGIPYRGLGWGESAVALAFSPDGKTVAISARDEQTGQSVKFWRVYDSALLGVLPQSAGDRPLAFSPDGKLLAVGTDYLATNSPLGAQLWNVATRTLVRAVAQPELEAAGYVSALAFNKKAKLLVTADDAGVIQLFDLASGKRTGTITTGSMGHLKLALAPDSKSMAYAGSSDPALTICALPSGKIIRTLGKSASNDGALAPVITALDFSPDGTLVAAAEGGENALSVVLYDVKGGKRLTELTGKTLTGNGNAPTRSDELRALRFSPDGAHLAWCGSTGVVMAKVGELLP